MPKYRLKFLLFKANFFYDEISFLSGYFDPILYFFRNKWNLKVAKENMYMNII